ncbi:HEAT repeat domain-containing protein [uncultured Rubinisphaera sp.]|uniref:HEAT repeat domain-containing protein n=1 Tax=uncultured Rubinisphaera sp. TaxID=1678686 RepID=UPI0030D8856E|tara:strand:- start:2175 stop:3902 length:1728 start_codon:yes stop_codon:yes gene_type:complete
MSLRKSFLLLGLTLLISFSGQNQPIQAADENEIANAIKKGVASLRTFPFNNKFVTGLVTYTLISSGESAESPEVSRGLEIITNKCRKNENQYQPTQHHYYEATIDIMALQAADPEFYVSEIEMIAQYIVDGQEEHGGWYYPNQPNNLGDTSITQYALLGLWAADRAGVFIPNDVFERAAAWHLSTQAQNGGYTYHPTNQPPNRSQIRGTMTLAGSGSLAVIRTILFQRPNAPTTDPNSKNPLNFLERVAPSSDINPANQVRGVPKAIRPQIDNSIKLSYQWIDQNYYQAPPNVTENHFYYYYYALERSATLNGWEKIQNQDWYADGAEILINRQSPGGNWIESTSYQSNAPSGTCFCLLFLMRATQKLIPQRAPTPEIGAGILAGGRGLPDDLTKVEFKDGQLKTEASNLGEFNQLMAGLSSIELPEIPDEKQPELTIDLSDREALIGNFKLLKQLSANQSPEVRQVAAWALGKSDQIEQADLLIELLKDPDLTVAIEARLALCWIARLPNGLGHELDPTAKYADANVQIDLKPIIKKWQTAVHKSWKQWYLEQRPYELRDDFEDPAQIKFQRKN